MFETGYVYTPNDISSEEFLSEAPINLIQESIKKQFKNPIDYTKKDYVDTFINKYKFSRENVNVYEDEEMDNLTKLRNGFYSFILTMFEKKLGIGVVDFWDMSESEQDDIIHYVYRFFLTNCKKNITSAVMNFIEDHHDSYAQADDPDEDVTTNSMKKYVDDPADLYVLGHMGDVIHDTMDFDMDIDAFFDLCDDRESPCLETEFVKEKFDKLVLTGNFVPCYFDLTDYSAFLYEVEAKVRRKILKKYSKKKD